MASHYDDTFTYEPWRHGGWYVNEVRYPSGAVGCVSRNYTDGKWRIACDPREGSYPGGSNDHTYPDRKAAARAEKELADAATAAAIKKASGHNYVFGGKGHPDSQPCVACGTYNSLHERIEVA